ncbi:scoloptoxin SSD14 [Dermacentor silvarum]|uniref:scoloptoxin SSD14 n=1 Tax=Dermacentor silvarum TaxID=543639 RepID=UPI002101C731|nr:scoloptoxin SSD14 [Dermacentor silvarum]
MEIVQQPEWPRTAVLDEGVPEYQLRQSARADSAGTRDVNGAGDTRQRLSAAGVSSGHTKWSMLYSLVVAGVVELSLIVAVVYMRRMGSGGEGDDRVFRLSGSDLRMVTPYANHTTVADVPGLCGAIPRKVYSRGGTVADCTVAFALCMAVVAPHRVGLAGGFFATVYERKSKQVVVLDAHAMAPRNMSEAEDVNASNPASSAGGKFMATPGYLPGLEALHSRFGRLPWPSLFENAISLAHFGFPVYPELAAILARFRNAISRRPSLRQIFWNRQTNAVYSVNETLLQPKLTLTLLRVAREGSKALSQGTLARQFIGDLEDLGSMVSQEDLVFYRPAWKAPVRSVPLAGVRLHAPPPPGGGVLLAFVLATMDMFRSSRKDLLSDGPLTYHRLIEAIKFAHPFREDLGDDAVENVVDTVANLLSRGQALKTSGRISDTSTYSDAIFYVFDMEMVREAIRGVSEKVALEHYSDLPRVPEHDRSRGRRDGSVHYDRATRKGRSRMGSHDASASTGLVLNNELHAFTSRLPDRYLGHAGVSLNFARPGKRPLSPLAPSLLLDAAGGRLVAALATSEDFELPQYAALVLCQLLLMNKTAADAVSASKVRYRASIKGILYDSDLPPETVRTLRSKGHRMFLLEDDVTNAAAIFSDEDRFVYAAVNNRIGGYCDGN